VGTGTGLKGAAGLSAAFGIAGAVVVVNAALFLALAERVDVAAHVATNKTARIHTPKINFAKFGFLVTGVLLLIC